VMNAIEKKIRKAVIGFIIKGFFWMANAVKSDKPPVISQYGRRRRAINPCAGEEQLII
jgi:hypothetical protein